MCFVRATFGGEERFHVPSALALFSSIIYRAHRFFFPFGFVLTRKKRKWKEAGKKKKLLSYLRSLALSLLLLLLSLHSRHDLNLRGLPLLALHVFPPLVENTDAKINLVLLSFRVSEVNQGRRGFFFLCGMREEMPSQIQPRDAMFSSDKAKKDVDAMR